MKRYISMLLCLVLLLTVPVSVLATETEATDISQETQYTVVGYEDAAFLKDGNINQYTASQDSVSITLENSRGMHSLYLLFDLEYGAYTVQDNNSGKTYTAGENQFIHEYIDLVAAFGEAPTSVTLDFAKGSVSLSEIYVFSHGETPDFVQKWELPLDGSADILMMPTHGDDDQLYFAGLLPYYAGELDCDVQVVYLTDHRCDTNVRKHEMLNGLWVTGVENYPIFAYDLDFRIDDLERSYKVYANYGISRDDLLAFVVEQFRRFKPQVVVGHDVRGEYGHGMHLVYADLIMKAVEVSQDPEVFPELTEQYGTWDVPKTYLHLWKENQIVLDYDIPLERFDGLTAFQVTQQYGFPCHKSQHIHDAFVRWLYGKDRQITKATQITWLSPCRFGLYRTTVGPDVAKNDFLENITTYGELRRQEEARLEQERLEQERLEQERLEQERLEQERLEQERLEQERLEQERLEQERLEAERLEQERLEQERLTQESLDEKSGFFGVLVALIPAAAMLFFSFRFGMSVAKNRFRQNPVRDRLEQNKRPKK